MRADSTLLPPAAIIGQLQALGIVPPKRRVRLQPLSRNSERLDFQTRHAFRVLPGSETAFFLLVGCHLEMIWRRARAVSRACPSLVAHPLFFHRTEVGDLLGLEFIEGTPLEGNPASSQLDSHATKAAAAAVIAALEQTLRPSTVGAAQRELEQFFSLVQACPIFDVFDVGFLRDGVFPWMRDELGHPPACTRWTNGDLIAKNVIINSEGQPKLVDYEFARRTHFHAEDALRWTKYSHIPNEALAAISADAPRCLEALFLLRQTLLEYHTSSPQLAQAGARERAERLRTLAAEAHFQFRTSLFLHDFPQFKSTVDAQAVRIEKLDRELTDRGLWGQTLDAEVKIARDRLADCQKTLDERTAWAQSLDREISPLRQKLADAEAAAASLRKEVEDRGLWGQTLDREVIQLRAASEAQLNELADVKRQRDASAQQAADLAAGIQRASAHTSEIEGRLAASQATLAEKTQETARLSSALASAQSAEREIRQQLARKDEDFRRDEEELARAQALIVQSITEIEELNNRKAWLEDKVRRMQSTFSWKSTTPLRAVRRLLSGK